MSLKEVYEKWLSLQPLNDIAQHLLSMKFTVEYNYNSNHIEGNTLTYGQTELLLLFGKVTGEGNLKDYVSCEGGINTRKIEKSLGTLSLPY